MQNNMILYCTVLTFSSGMEDNNSTITSFSNTRTKEDRKLGKKLNKCRHILLKHENLKPSYHPTKHLFVANGGLLNQVQHHEMSELFGQCGGLQKVSMVPGKSYCFVSFTETAFAKAALENLQAYELHDKQGPEKVILYLMYINQVPEHVMNTPDPMALPPGLFLVLDFIDEAMEEQLLCGLQWEASAHATDQMLKQRRVQHYGYRFCYDTNDVDRANPLPGGLGLYQDIADKILVGGLFKSPLDQLTINQYQPGHGIPSHVDTHSAFEESFCSLSLGSQVVMLFTHPSGYQIPVVVPPRSLLVFAGEARYLWSHGIVARKSDVIPTKDVSSEGALTVVQRGTRTSFTYRSVKWTPCQCKFPERCDSQGYLKTSEKTGVSTKSKTPVRLPSTESEAANLEANHVHTVYDSIAPHFSETRYKAWPPVVEFLEAVPAGSVLLDIGCGNGKYLGINSEVYKFGCDRSRNLIGICREKSYQAFVCDSLALPIRSDSLDVCICIAVLHHFTTLERRLQGLKEILRVLRPGGKALVTVWAMEQEKNKKKSTYLKKGTSNATHGGQSHEVDLKEFNENTEILNHTDTTKDDSKKYGESSNVKDVNISSLAIEPSRTHTAFATSEDTVNTDLSVHSNRTQFKQQDMLVPWHFKKPGEKVTNENDFQVYHRFYHVFVEGELESLCLQCPDIQIEKCYYVEGNWFVIFNKRHFR